MERLLLVDADVIIWLNQAGLWGSILKNYEIHVASTVVNEVTHYSDEFGRKISVDLIPIHIPGERKNIGIFQEKKFVRCWMNGYISILLTRMNMQLTWNGIVLPRLEAELRISMSIL